MAYTSAIQQQAPHTTYITTSSPSCSIRDIQKAYLLTNNTREFSGETEAPPPPRKKKEKKKEEKKKQKKKHVTKAREVRKSKRLYFFGN